MPFGVVIPEDGVPVVFPVLGALNVIVLFELHTLDFRVGRIREVIVLRFHLHLVRLPTS
jgi:hypothetical protein